MHINLKKNIKEMKFVIHILLKIKIVICGADQLDA